MKKLKKALVCLSITCSSLANAQAPQGTCEPFDPNNMGKYVAVYDSDTIKSVQNPFRKDSCVNIYYKSQSFLNPDKKFFGGNEMLINEYQKTFSQTGPQVRMTKDPSSGKIYSFMLLDMEDKDFQRFKRGADRMAMVNAHFDEFIEAHEFMHLNPSTTMSGMDIREQEAIADIGAVLFLGATNDFSLEQVTEMMKNVRNLRRDSFRKYDDSDHYHHTSFSRVINFLEKLEERGLDFNMGTLQEAQYVAMRIVKQSDADKMVDESIMLHKNFNPPKQEVDVVKEKPKQDHSHDDSFGLG